MLRFRSRYVPGTCPIRLSGAVRDGGSENSHPIGDAMENRQQTFGKESEAVAVEHLKKAGYRILEQNYRTRLGEIDIIARDKKTLVFVEVKARRSYSFGNPKAAVTPRKQRKISMVALSYLKAVGQERARARFDVVAVTAYAGEEKPVVEIIKNAFELAYV